MVAGEVAVISGAAVMSYTLCGGRNVSGLEIGNGFGHGTLEKRIGREKGVDV